MKLSMFVYNDLKTDARVKRSIEALKHDYDLFVCAADSLYDSKTNLGYRFENVIDGPGGRVLGLLRCLVKTSRAFAKENAEVMYFHDCFSAPLLLIMAVIKHKAIKVYDAHELMIPDSKSTFIEKLMYWVEKRAIKKADLVICASEKRKQLMEKTYQTKREIIVVNNISLLPRDIKIDEVYSKYPLLKDFMDNPGKTVIYAGFFGDRRIDLLIDAAAELKDRIKVLIVGYGSGKDTLLQKKTELDASNVNIMDAVPYSLLYPIFSVCDIGYLYYSNDRINNVNCAPNKIYEYASAGLPVVVNNNPGLLYYIEKFKMGIANDDIKAAIEGVLADWEYFKENAEAFIAQVDFKKEMNRLQSEIKKVVRM